MSLTDPTEQELEAFDHARKVAFADAFSFGEPPKRALLIAGYTTQNMSLVFTLLQDPEVQEVITRNREWTKLKLVENTDTVIQQLQRDRELAYDQGNPSAAIQATNSIAKILGLLEADKTGKVPARITIEWGGSETSDVLNLVSHD